MKYCFLSGSLNQNFMHSICKTLKQCLWKVSFPLNVSVQRHQLKFGGNKIIIDLIRSEKTPRLTSRIILLQLKMLAEDSEETFSKKFQFDVVRCLETIKSFLIFFAEKKYRD